MNKELRKEKAAFKRASKKPDYFEKRSAMIRKIVHSKTPKWGGIKISVLKS